MAESAEKMPKLDLQKDKPQLHQAQLYYMQMIENKNLERVQKLQKLRKRNLATAGILGIAVVSIFSYSMLAVKQEKFLDEVFDETEAKATLKQ